MSSTTITLPRKVTIRFIFVLSIPMILILLMWASMGSSRVAAGDNIWTWAGVSGFVEQIITDPVHPNIAYARIGDGRLMKSTNGGESWTNIAHASWNNLFHISMAASEPNVIYANTDQGIFRTQDGGIVWELSYPSRMVTSVAVSPIDSQTAYLADRSSYDMGETVITRTLDGGETWQTFSTDLPAGLAVQDDVGPAITISPSAPHIMIVKQSNTTPNGSLYKSMDAGQTWTEMPGPYSNVGVVTFDPKNSNTIYLGSYFSPGGWKSTDGGASWMPLANGLQANGRNFVIDPDNTQVIYTANGSGGVLESQDGGLSWTPIDVGIQGLTVNCIAIASRQPLVIYAGLSGGGIWKLTRTTIQDYSISINAGDLYTNQTAVTLNLTAPAGTTQMMISNDGGFGNANWETYQTQKQWTITEFGDYPIPRTVYAKFRTNGQVSGLYQDDIILDVTPPTGSVSITNTVNAATLENLAKFAAPRISSEMSNYLYLPAVMKNARPGYVLVGLALSAADNLSGVERVQISNDPSFAETEIENFAPVVNWWIPKDENTTVYVVFLDRAGNKSNIYTAPIVP